ncbi:MAG: PAS domain S-box protein, partial [Candidatus Hodarchaeota archaeon]
KLAYQANLLENVSDAIISTDKEFRILSWNKAAETIYKFCEEEVLGKTVSEVIPPEFENVRSEDTINQLFKLGYWKAEVIQKQKDGIPLNILSSVSLVKDEKGEAIGVVATNRDITDRKKIEEALNERVKELNCLYEISKIIENQEFTIPEILKKVVTLIPPAWRYPEITGGCILFKDQNYSTPQFQETPWIQIAPIKVGGKDVGKVMVAYTEQRKEEINGEGPFLKEERLLINSIAEQLRRFIERKQAENALRESEERFRNIIEQSHDGILLTNEQGNIIEWNPALEQILGIERGDAIGRPIWDINYQLVPKEKKKQERYEEVKVFTQQYLETGISPWNVELNEAEILTGDKISKFIQQSNFDYKTQNGIRIGGIIRDITEHKKTEAAIRENEEKFRVIAESALVGITILQDNRIKYLNDMGAQITGYTKEKLLDWSANEFFELIHPEDLPLMQEQFFKKQMGNSEGVIPRYTCRLISRTNEIKWIEIFSKTVIYRNKPADFVTVIDISEMKQQEAENLRLLSELKKINTELEDFAYIVSHDLKAPLRNIKLFSDLLLKDYVDKLDEKGKEYLITLEERVIHMYSLIEGILSYSRIGRLKEEKDRIDLNRLIEGVLELLAPPENIKITVDTNLPVILAERTKIFQIFQNILSNAVKFIDKPQGLVNLDCVDEGGYWQFSITDNGTGIEQKYFKKVFQLFQTIDPRSPSTGTGVGLTIVQKVVHSLGGKIWVDSAIGKGSTFFFTLPKSLQY